MDGGGGFNSGIDSWTSAFNWVYKKYKIELSEIRSTPTLTWAADH